MNHLSKSSAIRRQAPSALALTALAAAFTLCTSAHASNLIADSGFESAGGAPFNTYFAGQSIDGGSWNVTQGAVYIDTQDPYVYQGNNALNLTLANPYVPDSIAQTVATVVGQTYQISFYADSDSSNTFSLTEDGLTIAGTPSTIAQLGFPSLNNDGNSGLFTDYSAAFIATSTSTTLDFTSTADPAIGSPYGSVMIDNVSLQATPEPNSFLLLLTGIASAALFFGRRSLAGTISAS
jgi:hypothetical protein